MYKNIKENPIEETEGDAAIALTGEENKHFDAMREWILKVVKTNTGVVCADSHIGENLLLAQVSPCCNTTYVQCFLGCPMISDH